MEQPSIFAMNIKYLRLQKKFTQDYVATMLHTSRAAYCRWENGDREPKASQIPEIASVLESDIEALFSTKTTAEQIAELEQKNAQEYFEELRKNAKGVRQRPAYVAC